MVLDQSTWIVSTLLVATMHDSYQHSRDWPHLLLSVKLQQMCWPGCFLFISAISWRELEKLANEKAPQSALGIPACVQWHICTWVNYFITELKSWPSLVDTPPQSRLIHCNPFSIHVLSSLKHECRQALTLFALSCCGKCISTRIMNGMGHTCMPFDLLG